MRGKCKRLNPLSINHRFNSWLELGPRRRLVTSLPLVRYPPPYKRVSSSSFSLSFYPSFYPFVFSWLAAYRVELFRRYVYVCVCVCVYARVLVLATKGARLVEILTPQLPPTDMKPKSAPPFHEAAIRWGKILFARGTSQS